jgi:hypothetical protein
MYSTISSKVYIVKKIMSGSVFFGGRDQNLQICHAATSATRVNQGVEPWVSQRPLARCCGYADWPGRNRLLRNDLLTPDTGVVAGGTDVNLYLPASQDLLAIVYFGQNPATSVSPNSSQLHATTPAGLPGPVDVVSIMTDGSMLFQPEGFSYGPTILEVTPNASTADGGGTGMIYGYGFGAGPTSQIPQGLQVTIGGQQVQITAFNPNGYSYGTAPTPVQSLSFTIPTGTAGTVPDVSVTTPSGTATFHGGMQYLPEVQQVTLSGTASLAQGTYDALRDLYYFTDAAEIRVYSRSLSQWLTPIQVPAAPAGTTHRLWGIALSPNGSSLALADASAGMFNTSGSWTLSQGQYSSKKSTSSSGVRFSNPKPHRVSNILLCSISPPLNAWIFRLQRSASKSPAVRNIRREAW